MSFVRNAKVMLIGFALAQAMPLLASPLLTRLFSPDAFGLQTVFISSATILAVLATMRLDLAVVLADSREDVARIVSLVGLQTAAVVTAVALLALFLGPRLATAVGHPGQVGWIWALVPMVAGLATVQTVTGLLTWSKRFGPTSQAQVANQATYLAAAFAIGSWAVTTEGLVAAKVTGQLVAAGLLVLASRSMLAGLHIPSPVERAALWSRFRPFLVFNTPYSLIGALGREVPIFAFSAVAATASAGFYGLARTLLGAPSTLLAASLSQVFYREAAEHRGTSRLQTLTLGLLGVTMRATAPAFAFLIVWSDVAFAFVFGADWETAGRYAMILAIPAWLGIQTAWPERLYESVGRQGTSFAIQVTFDIMTAAAIFGAVFTGLPHIVAVAIFALLNSTFHLTYLTGMFRVAGFSLGALARTAGAAIAVLACATGIMVILRWLALPDIWGLVVAGGLTGCAVALLGVTGYRSIRPMLHGDPVEPD